METENQSLSDQYLGQVLIDNNINPDKGPLPGEDEDDDGFFADDDEEDDFDEGEFDDDDFDEEDDDELNWK